MAYSKYKPGDLVKYQGEFWNISEVEESIKPISYSFSQITTFTYILNCSTGEEKCIVNPSDLLLVCNVSASSASILWKHDLQ